MNEVVLKKNLTKRLIKDGSTILVFLMLLIIIMRTSLNALSNALLIGFMVVMLVGIVSSILKTKPLLKFTDEGVTIYTLLKDEVLIPWLNINKIELNEEMVIKKVMGMSISNRPKKVVKLEMEIKGQDLVKNMTSVTKGEIQEELKKIAEDKNFDFKVDLSEVGSQEEIRNKIKESVSKNLSVDI
ncbi:MAG: hypothetical protein JJE03_07545 [Peptostreptococcaceae bacterium]|nr:hypothetical protein [Peptostreptococcaceae bacterium]